MMHNARNTVCQILAYNIILFTHKQCEGWPSFKSVFAIIINKFYLCHLFVLDFNVAFIIYTFHRKIDGYFPHAIQILAIQTLHKPNVAAGFTLNRHSLNNFVVKFL